MQFWSLVIAFSRSPGTFGIVWVCVWVCVSGVCPQVCIDGVCGVLGGGVCVCVNDGIERQSLIKVVGIYAQGCVNQ